MFIPPAIFQLYLIYPGWLDIRPKPDVQYLWQQGDRFSDYDSGSELAMVIEEEKIGWVVTSFMRRDVVEVILTARNNKPLILEMGKRARMAAEQKLLFCRNISPV